MHYPRIASRVFNTPLFISRPKLDVLLGVLEPIFQGHKPASALDDPSGGADKERGYTVTDGGVAIVPIQGTLVKKGSWMSAASGLTGYDWLAATLLDAATDPKVRGILLDIDSPGGEAAGMFDLVDTLKEVRALKPLWAVANDEAFSAAYAIASSAERLYVTRTGGVGSVGVVAVHLDESRRNEEKGLKYTVFRAGKYKAEHNPLEPLTDHATETLQAEIDRLYELFVGVVAENRRISTEFVRGTEAQLYFAEGAVSAKLADRVGNLSEALADLEAHVKAGSVVVGITYLKALETLDSLLGFEDTATPTPRGAAAPNTHTEVSMSNTPTPAADAAGKVISLDQARIDERVKVLGYVREVNQLCALAGLSHLAADFIGREVPVEAVRAALLEHKARADEQFVLSSVADVAPARTTEKAVINVEEVYGRLRQQMAAR